MTLLKFLGILVGILMGIKLAAWLLPIPGFDPLIQTHSVMMTDRFGIPLRELYTEGLSKQWVSLADVPPTYLTMLVMSEDKRFFWHPGIDPIAITRALIQNRKAKKRFSGASTLTQQWVKLVSGKTQSRGVSEKIKEMCLALLLELKYSKKTMLEAYINTVYFGYQTQGLSAAAQFYFGKSPKALSLMEQAALIAIAKSPVGYNPIIHPKAVDLLAKQILRKAGYSSEIQVPLVVQPHFRVFSAPHFIHYVQSTSLVSGQNRCVTTLDSSIQNQVTLILQQELEKLKRANVKNAACVVVEVKTGAILAYVGSQDFFSKQYQGEVDGVQSKRQPGSALKPFVYEYAFEQGYTPASVLPDLPLTYFSNRGYYTPKNYSETYLGHVSIRTALSNSLNAPVLFLANQLPLTEILNRLRSVGFKSLTQHADYYGLGLVLGNGEVSLLELAQAYTCLANAGRFIPLNPVLSMSKPETYSFPQVMDETDSYLITSILSDDVARQYAFGRHSSLNQNFPCAVKTGTSTNYRDNWCIGYTPDFVVAVWVGNFDNSAMYGVSGVTGAGPIWHRVMKFVVDQRQTPFEVPPNVIKKTICQDSFQVATKFCPYTMLELFSAPMAAHLQACPLISHTSSTVKILQNSNSQWQTEPAKKPLAILYPKSGSLFAIDPRIDRNRQKIRLEASVIAPATQPIVWYIDSLKIQGNTWILQKGTHHIKAKMQLLSDEAIIDVL